MIMNEKAMAAAIRQVARGLAEMAAVLDGNVPGDDRTNRRIALMRRFDVSPDEGLDRKEASQVFRENGYNPRSFGGWVRRGLIERTDDRRYLTIKGRELLAELAAREPTDNTNLEG
jgi:hypothetical protein